MKISKTIVFFCIIHVYCFLLFAQESVQNKEILSRRSYYSKTFFDSKSELHNTKIYSYPIHYKDKDGNYLPINTSLHSISDNEYNFTVTEGIYQAYFKSDLAKSFPVKFQLHNGVYLTSDPVAIAYYESKTGNYKIIEETNTTSAKVSDNDIRYDSAFDGVDIVYTYNESKLKEEVIFHPEFRNKLPSPESYGFKKDDTYLVLSTIIDYSPELIITEEDSLGLAGKTIAALESFSGQGRIYFKLKDQVQFSLPPDFIDFTKIDSSQSIDENVDLWRSFLDIKDMTHIISGISYNDFINMPAGDIVLDPSIETSLTATEDTWLENTGVKGYYTFIIVGKDRSYPKKRSILKFNISSLPSNCVVTEANLNSYYYRYGGTSVNWVDHPVRVYRLTRYWLESQATKVKATSTTNWTAYWAEGDYDTSYTDEFIFTYADIVNYGWRTFDVKDIVQDWVDGTTNYGLLLKSTNEDTYGCDVRFYSSEYGTSSLRPYLEITYRIEYTKYFYLKDHLGNIRVTIDDEGDVKEYDDYYPFGLQLPQRTYVSGSSNSIYKFSSKEKDGENNLDWYYFGARYYDPEVGRWLSIDPLAHIAPGWSPYNYTFNNPTNLTDPDGRFPWGAVIGAAVEYGFQVYDTGNWTPTTEGAVKIGIAAAAGAATSGLSSLAGRIGGGAVIHAVEGVAKNAISGNQITVENVVTDAVLGSVSGGVSQAGKTVAQGTKTANQLAKQAKTATNIANTGRTRAAQTASATQAQQAAQNYGSGAVANTATGVSTGMIGNTVQNTGTTSTTTATNQVSNQSGVANSDNTRTVIKKDDDER